ncbi:MAG TPA: class I SAM-dependent methyltransferase [Thermoanaerobaculia bacterium]|nr:class I SAM-dependent methyltransferase [Thermoanaerobaculia bacterium]
MDLNVLTLRHFRTISRIAMRKAWQRLRHREPAQAAPPAAEDAKPAEPLIDVREMIANSSIPELNRIAELYFSSVTDRDYYLAKPFSVAGDTPALLINFATMVQGMNLAPGTRVLDFGAGTGWTSRYMSQLGCAVTLLDVSPTALEIARDLYQRQPLIGDRPEPKFLVFDGFKIDLPDGSVDRILCFDSFHHAPNPRDVLFEFARILAPGGIAAFAEPGPEHSKMPQSQFEMRTHGVIENDIDIRAIWSWAQEAGFVDLKLAAYHIPPFHLSLDAYEELLRGGESYLRWAELTRAFLGNVRNFFLKREGQEPLDSRRPESLIAKIEIDMPSSAKSGEKIPVRATITNEGRAVWLPSGVPPGGVSLGAHLYGEQGQLIRFDHHWQALTDPVRRIEPGETVSVQFALPPLDAGHYTIEFDCVADRVAWFTQVGSSTVRRALVVA